MNGTTDLMGAATTHVCSDFLGQASFMPKFYCIDPLPLQSYCAHHSAKTK